MDKLIDVLVSCVGCHEEPRLAPSEKIVSTRYLEPELLDRKRLFQSCNCYVCSFPLRFLEHSLEQMRSPECSLQYIFTKFTPSCAKITRSANNHVYIMGISILWTFLMSDVFDKSVTNSLRLSLWLCLNNGRVTCRRLLHTIRYFSVIFVAKEKSIWQVSVSRRSMGQDFNQKAYWSWFLWWSINDLT